MTYGSAVETLEERVLTQSSNVNKILKALARLRKDLPQIYKSQADIAYTQALIQNEVLLKEQASKFEKRIDNLDSWEQFETEDERDEYLRIKSHEWVQEQSVIFVKDVIDDMHWFTDRYMEEQFLPPVGGTQPRYIV